MSSMSDMPVGLAASPVPSGVAVPPTSSDRADTFRRLLKSKTFVVGAVILIFWILSALFGSYFTQSPYATSEDTLQGLSSAHWFGTDKVGRDVFARVIAGSSDILVVSTLATALGILGGTFFGLVTGYFRGAVDNVLSRIIDAMLALPLVIIAIVVVTSLGISNTTLIITIGVVFTPLISRTVRTSV